MYWFVIVLAAMWALCTWHAVAGGRSDKIKERPRTTVTRDAWFNTGEHGGGAAWATRPQSGWATRPQSGFVAASLDQPSAKALPVLATDGFPSITNDAFYGRHSVAAMASSGGLSVGTGGGLSVGGIATGYMIQYATYNYNCSSKPTSLTLIPLGVCIPHIMGGGNYYTADTANNTYMSSYSSSTCSGSATSSNVLSQTSCSCMSSSCYSYCT